MSKQHGFSVVELGIICVVVLLVGALGYVFYDRWIDGVANTEIAQTRTAEDDVPTISSVDDLAKVELALDEANLDDDSSLSSLDAEFAHFE